MYSFLISLAVLIFGYLIYGSFIAKLFGVQPNRNTPAATMADGIDYVPLPTWRVFLIQFLNIAGLGPIFGAIMGIQYGPAAFLWIALGTIFGGAVHDYLAGMISLRKGGASLPEIVGDELGTTAKSAMRIFSLVLMILVGAVFVINPADLLSHLWDGMSVTWWVVIIFAYYMLATLLPIDKLIGRVYPLFGLALLFMALGIFVMLIPHLDSVPEFVDGLYNRYNNPETHPIFPMMFVSIACGAISGFHATQSPMMARCLKNEKYGRSVFYGAMVAEGIVALIWAAAAIAFVNGDFGALNDMCKGGAANVVNAISNNWLGTVGGIFAVLGVVAAPITSGDTALRSARLIAADWFGIKQDKILSRLVLSLPIFLASMVIMLLDYSVLWRYFGWCNQALSVFTLWAITVYFYRRRKLYIVTLVPAMFMTMVCSCYIIVAPEGFGWTGNGAYLAISALITMIMTAFCYSRGEKLKAKLEFDSKIKVKETPTNEAKDSDFASNVKRKRRD